MLRTFASLSFLAGTYARHSSPTPVFYRAAFASSAIASPTTTFRGSPSVLCTRLHRGRSAAMSSTSESVAAADLPYRYRWPRPAVTVDCLIYALDQGEPWILLIKRKNDPCKGTWALPGGFVDENESLETAALRELEEETGVTSCKMAQTGAYGDAGRDPRGHTVTIAFMAWAPSRDSCNAKAGDDAAEAQFYPVKSLPKIAFDHMKIISDSWARCRFEVGTNAASGVVIDRATDQTLGVYEVDKSTIEEMAALVPVEAESG